MLRRIIATSGTWAPLPLRMVVGAVFIAHGAQKLFGVFGGSGFANWIAIPPPLPFMQSGAKFWMAGAAIAEFGAGILVALGLLTRLGALVLLCAMVTVIVGVQLHNGFFAPAGYEYHMTLAGICLALLIAGGGQLSADMVLGQKRRR